MDLFDRLESARRHAFVGRPDELALFADALTGPGGVLYVHGPGGVGKSALLRQYAWAARTSGRTTIWVDARDAGRETATLDAWAGDTSAPVLLVDTAERLGPLDRWLRDDVLGRLPAGAMTVIAGRERPPLAWRLDPGWSRLVRTIPLTNLSTQECTELLTRQGVPAGEHGPVLAFTRGHPLALALVSDARGQRGRPLATVQCAEVVTALLDVLLDTVPSADHRAALEACALVRVTTEPLLAALLACADARPLFDWLRGLSVIELGTRGVLPHDLVRDALAAEVRWRHPERHTDLRRRANEFYRAQLDDGGHATLVDCAFLYRDHPVIGRVLSALAPDAPGPHEFVTVRARPTDAADILSMVERHEGRASADLAAHWLACQPHHAYVVRDPDGATAGYVQFVALTEASAALPEASVALPDAGTDPALVAARAYLPSGAGILVRFWMSRDGHQDFSPAQTEITLRIIEQSLTTPGLAVTLIGCANPDDWADVAALTRAARVPTADFTVDGRTVAAFALDWRAIPPMEWLGLIAGLDEEPGPPTPVPAPRDAPPAAEAMSADAFAGAVRLALRDLCRPDRLRDSPLLRCRLVERAHRADATASRIHVLQQTIRAAAAVLEESPRDRGVYRTLHHTYLQPAGTQRDAAELLRLPTSTYRRYLAAGVDQLVTILWQREQDPG